MRQITVIQLFLIGIVIMSSVLFFSKNFDNFDKIKTTQNIDLDQNTSSNFIEKINYISSDNNGNKYIMTAELAEIDNKQTEVMFLNDVVAYIYTNDGSKIKITSDFGKYNTENYNTIFSFNVKVYYTNQIATGEYLDFSFQNSLATMSDNVIYINKDIELNADKIEIDIITKDSKIFMNELNKKVTIEKKN